MIPATDVTFNDNPSNLGADSVQEAIDKIYARSAGSWKVIGADPTGDVDATALLQAAIDAAAAAGGGIVEFARPGRYQVNQAALKSNVSVNVGAGVVLEPPAGSNNVAFHTKGAVGEPENTLSETAYDISNVSLGSLSVTTTTAADAGKFAAGEYAIVRSSVFVNDRFGRQQDYLRVASANATTGVITFTTPISDTYTSSPEIVRWNPVVNAHIFGHGKIVNAIGTDTGGGVLFDYTLDCSVQGLTFERPNNIPAITFHRSKNPVVKGTKGKNGQNLSLPGTGYHISIDDSTVGARVYNNYTEKCRENAFGARVRDFIYAFNTCVGNEYNGVNTHATLTGPGTIGFNSIEGTRLGYAIGVSYLTGYLDGVDHGINIVGNTLRNNYAGAIQVVGQQGTSSPLYRPRDVLIDGNTIENTGNGDAVHPINLYRADKVIVRSNRISGFKGIGQIGILATESDSVDISGNIVDGAIVGIRLAQCTCSTVSGNRLRECSGYNIETQASQANSGNRVFGNSADNNLASIGSDDAQWDNSWSGPTQSGSTQVTISNGSTANTQIVAFPIPMPTAAWKIAFGVEYEGEAFVASVNSGSKTTAGFTLVVSRASTSGTKTIDVDWTVRG